MSREVVNSKVESKKPYTQPKLTTHGDAQSLTQHHRPGSSCGSGLPFQLR